MSAKVPQPKLPIGQIAVQKGYCTPEQVDEALRIQAELAAGGRPRPLTGILMVRHGILSTGQLIDILKAYQHQAQG